MAKARICNRIIHKKGIRGYETYVGQISQIAPPIRWVKKNIDFKGEEWVEWEY